MASTQLTYSATPTQVAISTQGAASGVDLTVTIANMTPAKVNLVQVVLTIPQGTGPTDLLAPNTSFSPGSVHASNATRWSLGVTHNQATLDPVSSQGYATLGPNDTLQFTLSQLQINSTGAGQSASIQIVERDLDAAPGGTTIGVQKLDPGFRIEAFYASQYNLDVNDPVTITWKVFQALSCEVTARVLSVAPAAVGVASLAELLPSDGLCGVGTANPTCNGTLATGTDFDDSRTCTIVGPTLFTLTAYGKSTNQDVNLTSQLLVTVNQPAIAFDIFPPAITRGDSVNLTWRSANAAKLLLYSVPSVGPVPPPVDLTNTPQGSRSDAPLVDTTYTLYAFRHAGDTQPAADEPRPIKVAQPAPKIDSFTWKFQKEFGPTRLILNWATRFAAVCNISGDPYPVNVSSQDDSYTVALPWTGSYTLTAKSDIGVVTSRVDVLTWDLTSDVAVGGRMAGLAVASDGKTLLVASSDSGVSWIRRVDAATLAPIGNPVKVGTSDPSGGIAVSPDGQRVYAITEFDKSVRVLDAGSLQPAADPVALSFLPVDVAVSASGHRVYVVGNLNGVFSFDPADPKNTQRTVSAKNGYEGISEFSPGRLLAATSGMGAVVLDAATLAQVGDWFWSDMGLIATASSFAGVVFITATAGIMGPCRIEVLGASGQTLARCAPAIDVSQRGLGPIAVSPDGLRLYAARDDGHIMLFTLRPQGGPVA